MRIQEQEVKIYDQTRISYSGTKEAQISEKPYIFIK